VTHQFQKYLLKLCLRYEIYLFEEVPKFEFKISSLDNEHDFQHCCFFLVIMYVSKLGSGSVTSTHFQLKHNSAESHIVRYIEREIYGTVRVTFYSRSPA
jgi:hypothetical protein